MAKRKAANKAVSRKPASKVKPGGKATAGKRKAIESVPTPRRIVAPSDGALRKSSATRAAVVKPPRPTKVSGHGAVNGDGGTGAISLRKTTLNSADLEEFRQLLMEKRAELLGDVAHLENEAMHQGSSGETSGNSSMPIHMADLGSDTWEQELTLGLIENERGLLREIDEALDRISNRTYGICIATNRPISKARLRAKPWAKYCIEYARQHERGLG